MRLDCHVGRGAHLRCCILEPGTNQVTQVPTWRLGDSGAIELRAGLCGDRSATVGWLWIGKRASAW